MTDKEMVDLLNMTSVHQAPCELHEELLYQKLRCHGEHVTLGYALYLRKRIKELEAFKRNVDEALNSGDGTYRP